MKTISIKNTVLLILTCFLSLNGWLEEVKEQDRDYISMEKPISDHEVRRRVYEPFNSIHKLFDELNIEFNNLLKEKNDFDDFASKVLQIARLSEQSVLVSKFKSQYQTLNLHVAEFSNVLISGQKKLDEALLKSKIISEQLRLEYGSKKYIIQNSRENTQKEHKIYQDWLFITTANTAKILRDLNLLNIRFEKKIDEEFKLQVNIPEPQKITNVNPPKKLLPIIKPEVKPAPKPVPKPIAEIKPKPIITQPAPPEPVIEKPVVKKENILREIKESDLKQDIPESDNLLKSGDELLNRGKYLEAKTKYKKSAQLNKNNYLAIAGISKVYIKTKEYDSAVETINAAIDIYKKNTPQYKYR